MKATTKTKTKLEALAEFLGANAEDITDNGNEFEAEGGDYLVLTDEEADQATADYIRETLWAFRPEFLLSYMPDGLEEKDIAAIQERCESANPAIKALVGDNLQDLIDGAIGADGRGHFLSGYDGNENEQGEYFIYRTN